MRVNLAAVSLLTCMVVLGIPAIHASVQPSERVSTAPFGPQIGSYAPNTFPLSSPFWPTLTHVELPKQPDPWQAVDDARAYLMRIAQAGGVMDRIGKQNAIGWLHPEYALRAARVAMRARAEAIPANCSSAYRPYGLGVGGFKNKRNSRHTFGLACDWAGIGGAGSSRAIRFYQIAREEGLCNPYGPKNGAEWNHYQLDCGRSVPLTAKIQNTVSSKGPLDPKRMWDAAAVLLGKIIDTTLYGLQSAKIATAVAAVPAPPKVTKVAKRTKHRATKVAHHHKAKKRYAKVKRHRRHYAKV